MSINVLFIHSAGPQSGDEGSAPFVKNLRQSLGPNYNINAPIMPDPDEPSYKKWKPELDKHLNNTSPAILIGHSLGASILLKYLSEEKQPISSVGLFLVATPFWGNEDWDVSEFLLRDKFSAFLPDTLKIYLYQSQDDEVIPAEHLSRYINAIPTAEVRRSDGHGHTFKDGLPELVKDIENLSGLLNLE